MFAALSLDAQPFPAPPWTAQGQANARAAAARLAAALNRPLFENDDGTDAIALGEEIIAERQRSAAEEERARIFNMKPIDPFRREGDLKVAANGPGWVKFWGKVTGADGVRLIVSGGFTNKGGGFSGSYVVLNFSKETSPGDVISWDKPYWAKEEADAMVGRTNFHVLNYEAPYQLTAGELAAKASALEEKRAELVARALEADERAASAGDVFAELQMGKRYRDGDGVAKDPAKAREWFAKAAAKGNADAQRAVDILAAQGQK